MVSGNVDNIRFVVHSVLLTLVNRVLLLAQFVAQRFHQHYCTGTIHSQHPTTYHKYTQHIRYTWEWETCKINSMLFKLSYACYCCYWWQYFGRAVLSRGFKVIVKIVQLLFSNILGSSSSFCLHFHMRQKLTCQPYNNGGAAVPPVLPQCISVWLLCLYILSEVPGHRIWEECAGQEVSAAYEWGIERAEEQLSRW